MAELGKGPGAQLECEISVDSDGSPIVSLRGELDMSTAPGLDSRLAPIIARNPDRLVVDARGLEFADSSAIALLVRWANLVSHVEIREPPDLLRRVIARMGLSERLHVRP
jgi:anti-anti-sigma factor